MGTIKWFLIPLITSLKYSFETVTPATGGVQESWVGFQNYVYAFGVDPNYSKYLVSVLKDTAIKTPLIIIFSLFVAVMLNQKFKGRGFARAVFFLPVIIATGPVYAMTETIQSITTDIFSLVWNSGIQILIFLAALQNIPVSAKEAAQMEGATAWEYFWKITFPYVSPMILANLIFTIIDSFTDTSNSVMNRILEVQSDWKYGEAAAMAWSYFAIVMVAVGIITVIVNKFIYYEVD